MILDPRNIEPRVPIAYDVKLGETILENVKFNNYHGVVLDDALSFERFMKEKM